MHTPCTVAKRLAAKGAHMVETDAMSAESLRAAFEGAYGVWGMTPVVATSAAGAKSPYEQEIELGAGPQHPCSQNHTRSCTCHLRILLACISNPVCKGLPYRLTTATRLRMVAAATASACSEAVRVVLSNTSATAEITSAQCGNPRAEGSL